VRRRGRDVNLGTVRRPPLPVDRNDAKDIVQARTGWFRTVHVKSEGVQTLQALLVRRRAILGGVLPMENMIRGLLRPFYLKVGRISVDRLDARVHEIMAGKKKLEAVVASLVHARNAMPPRLAELQRPALMARPHTILLLKIRIGGTTFQFDAGNRRGRGAASTQGPPRPGPFHEGLRLPPRRSGVFRGGGAVGETGTFVAGGFEPLIEVITNGAA